MTQVARNVTMAAVGFLSSSRYLIQDRDSKFCKSFHRTIEAVGVAPVPSIYSSAPTELD